MITLRDIVYLFESGNEISVRDNDGKIVFCAYPDGGVLDLSGCKYLDHEITKLVPRAHHMIVYVDVFGGKLCG